MYEREREKCDRRTDKESEGQRPTGREGEKEKGQGDRV